MSARSTSCVAKWKLTKPSSAARPATCTLPNALGESLAAGSRRRLPATGGKDKVAVLGILERGGNVRTHVVGDRRKKTLHAEVHKHVEAGAALYTDELMSYEGLAGRYVHQVIDHAVKYVNKNVHTNGMENYWSLLKRGLAGTYVSVEPYHLFRYLDEQAYRFNNRKNMSDFDRFQFAATQIVGKRLTWKQAIGMQESATWAN
jgi:hypothetical protein